MCEPLEPVQSVRGLIREPLLNYKLLENFVAVMSAEPFHHSIVPASINIFFVLLYQSIDDTKEKAHPPILHLKVSRDGIDD